MTDMQATKSTEDNKASIGASENGVGTEVPMSYAFVAQPFVLGTEKSRKACRGNNVDSMRPD